MAEGILRSRVDGDIRVLSAGIGAVDGGAHPYAIKAMEELGIDITDHRRRPLERWMVEEASYIFALDEYVYDVLASEFNLSSRLHTLKGFAYGVDEPLGVFDPYGEGLDAFRACRDEIAELIEKAIERGLLDQAVQAHSMQKQH